MTALWEVPVVECTQIAVLGCGGTRWREAKAQPSTGFGPLARLLLPRRPAQIVIICDDGDAAVREVADGVVSAFPGAIRTEVSVGDRDSMASPCKEPAVEASRALTRLGNDYAGSSVVIVGQSHFLTASFLAFGHLDFPPRFDMGDKRSALCVWETEELLIEPDVDALGYWYPPRWSLMFCGHWLR